MRSAEGGNPGQKQDGEKSLLRKPRSGKILGNTDKEGGGGGDGILVELSQGFHQKLKKSVLGTEEMAQLVKKNLSHKC